MSMTPDRRTRPAVRRRVIIGGVVAVAVIAVAGIAFGWWFFFGTEAPPSPTLDDALRVLQSPAPAE